MVNYEAAEATVELYCRALKMPTLRKGFRQTLRDCSGHRGKDARCTSCAMRLPTCPGPPSKWSLLTYERYSLNLTQKPPRPSSVKSLRPWKVGFSKLLRCSAELIAYPVCMLENLPVETVEYGLSEEEQACPQCRGPIRGMRTERRPCPSL